VEEDWRKGVEQYQWRGLGQFSYIQLYCQLWQVVTGNKGLVVG